MLGADLRKRRGGAHRRSPPGHARECHARERANQLTTVGHLDRPEQEPAWRFARHASTRPRHGSRARRARAASPTDRCRARARAATHRRRRARGVHLPYLPNVARLRGPRIGDLAARMHQRGSHQLLRLCALQSAASMSSGFAAAWRARRLSSWLPGASTHRVAERHLYRLAHRVSVVYAAQPLVAKPSSGEEASRGAGRDASRHDHTRGTTAVVPRARLPGPAG